MEYILGSILGLVILYYIIKKAVKNGQLEAQKETKKPKPPSDDLTFVDFAIAIGTALFMFAVVILGIMAVN